MKAVFLGAGSALILAGCASAPREAPAPAAAPPAPAAPVPEPVPPPPPPPPPATWEDLPLSPGDWRFTAGPPAAAEYGEAGAAMFSIRCDTVQRRILLSRPGAPGTLTIRTTYGSRDLAAADAEALPATDPFLDEMVFSRGRFAVEAAGQPLLILPTWPEPARVIEECRP
jgi:hypothetical protein